MYTPALGCVKGKEFLDQPSKPRQERLQEPDRLIVLLARWSTGEVGKRLVAEMVNSLEKLGLGWSDQ